MRKSISWKDLGIEVPEGSTCMVYDYWDDRYLGSRPEGIDIDLSRHACRVLCVVPEREHPWVVSTRRHITQGAMDLVDVSWDDAATATAQVFRLAAGRRAHGPVEYRV